MSGIFAPQFNAVNALFTITGYAHRMAYGLPQRVLSLSDFLHVLALAAVAFTLLAMPQAALAQSEDIDWADAGAQSLGVFPNGTVVTGSDGTTATVTRTVATEGAGSFVPVYSSDFLSYFSGTIGSGVSPLLLSFDNSSYDPRDKITVTITLSRAVSNLTFSMGDIDAGSFSDAVEIYYDNDLSGSYVNAATNTAFWTTGSAVTRTNDATVNGWRGTSGSATAATDGNINLSFGSQQVRRIQIVYFSYTGTGDPTGQFAGISDLVYSEAGADLSLTKTLIGSPPTQGGTATWRLTVTSDASSTETTNGVVVRDSLPSGFTFVSSSGDGSFNSATGDWTVGTLAPGASATRTIQGTISSTAGTTITNTAQITASSANDPDSTPNNGVTTEDDFASSSFVVQSGRAPGVPPTLACPAGQSVFDWDAISGWTAGSVDNTYAFASFGNVRFQLTNNGAYINNALFGGNSPNVFTYFNGGTGENTLQVVSDQANQTGVVTITITLPRSFTGLQFAIHDVDFGANQFADRLVVTGSNGGTSVNPTLTNGNVNFVSGNTIIGDGAAGNNEALGNTVITFTQAVNTITIQYGNHTTAPADPGQQGIGLHDISVCDPFAALSVSKVSSIIADPVNGTTNPKAIPGATVEYLITVSNSGPSATDADTVQVWDDGPADAKMCLIARNGGPVIFADPGSNSGLTYQYGGAGSVAGDLGVTSDDIEFSDDNGASFSYTPSDDGTGCDPAITDFRINPGGALASGGTFTLTFRYEVE